MVESEDLDEEGMKEYKLRCICESQPVVRKHPTISVERPTSVAIGYYPIEVEGANLHWYLAPQEHGTPHSTYPVPVDLSFQPGHSVKTSLFL
jgi:hypothetical protein